MTLVLAQCFRFRDLDLFTSADKISQDRSEIDAGLHVPVLLSHLRKDSRERNH